MKKFVFIAVCAVFLVVPYKIGTAGGGTPDPPINEQIFAGIDRIDVNAPFSFDSPLTLDAFQHLSAELNDEDDMITTSYGGGNHLYAEYGVTSSNCTDRMDLTAISQSNGVTAFGFTHNVRFSGEVFLQIVSQCHNDGDSDSFGEGIWWKGKEFYSGQDYPTVPTDDIVIDFYAVTNCTYPPNGVEYGCSFDG